MTAFKKILLATDFSENSNASVPYAVSLAQQSGGTLHVLHVFESGGTGALLAGVIVGASAWIADLRKKYEAKLENLAQELEKEHGLKVVWSLVSGHPVHEIVEQIKVQNPDLTVLATHGHGALAGLFLGSVAERVVRLSSKPVLTVRPSNKPSGAPVAFKRILVPTDFSKNSEAAWPQALELAKQHNGSLLLVNAIEPSIYYANATMSEGMGVDVEAWLVAIRKNAEEQLRAAASKLSSMTSQPVSTLLLEGRAADQVVSAATKEGADLIVLTTHGYTGVSHVLFGSVAEKIVRTSLVPVISIKPQ